MGGGRDDSPRRRHRAMRSAAPGWAVAAVLGCWSLHCFALVAFGSHLMSLAGARKLLEGAATFGRCKRGCVQSPAVRACSVRAVLGGDGEGREEAMSVMDAARELSPRFTAHRWS